MILLVTSIGGVVALVALRRREAAATGTTETAAP
jgi:hypothetical protein